jgi:hypothetical protein
LVCGINLGPKLHFYLYFYSLFWPLLEIIWNPLCMKVRHPNDSSIISIIKNIWLYFGLVWCHLCNHTNVNNETRLFIVPICSQKPYCRQHQKIRSEIERKKLRTVSSVLLVWFISEDHEMSYMVLPVYKFYNISLRYVSFLSSIRFQNGEW